MKVKSMMNEKLNNALNQLVSIYHMINVWGFYYRNAGKFSYKNEPGQGRL